MDRQRQAVPTPTLAARRGARWLTLLIALSVAGYIAAALALGWRDVLAGLAVFGPLGLAGAVSATLCGLGLRSTRWLLYFRELERPVPRVANLRIYLSGFALTGTPGKTGELVRAFFLKRWGVPYTESIATFFCDRATDLMAVATLGTAAVLVFPAAGVALAIATIALFAAVAALTRPWTITRLTGLISRAASARGWTRHLAHLLWIVRHGQRLLRARVLAPAFLLALGNWCLDGVILYFACNALGFEIGFASAQAVFALARLIGVASLVPGGIGVLELSMAGLLLALGMDATDALVCTLFVRISTYWTVVAVGVVAMALQLRRGPDEPAAQP